jgi:hypothetical protein
VLNGDSLFISVLSLHGKAKFFAHLKGAYREHDAGVWSGSCRHKKNDEHINTLFWILQYHIKIKSQYVNDLRLKHLKLCIGAVYRVCEPTSILSYFYHALKRKVFAK